MRGLLPILLLGGCLDIRAEGGNDAGAYEAGLPELLREGSQTLWEAEGGYGKEPQLEAYFDLNGRTRARVDPYRLATDREEGGLNAPFAVELIASDGGVQVAEDSSHFELLAAWEDAGLSSRLFCSETVELWLYKEATGGNRSVVVDFDAADACNKPALLGASDVSGELALLLDGTLERLTVEEPEAAGLELTRASVDGVALPDEPLWLQLEGGEAVVVGRTSEGRWSYDSGSDERVVAEQIVGEPLGIAPVTSVGPGVVEVRTTQGQWRWEPGVEERELATYDAPSIDAEWRPGAWPGGALAVERGAHPEEERLEVERAVEALVDGSRIDVPLTGCDSAEACLEFGEWSVVGLYEGTDQWYAIYRFHSWWYSLDGADVYGIYLSPL